ncbi:MAG: phosphatase PAP2 family protein [Myxococcales bacterium]|nr:phosphatase PAP2 family protein [Myxococcales bacterium]
MLRVFVVTLLLAGLAPASASAQRLAWQEDWRRASWPDGVVIAVGFAGAATLALAVDDSRAGWVGAGPVDRAVLRLGADAPTTRRRASIASDVFLALSLASGPTLVEPLVAWRDHQGVAAQLAVASFRSFALTSLALSALKYGLRRRRPTCDEAGLVPCAPQAAHRSFPSGHAALAFTAASLSCTAHRHLPLYGASRGARVAACGAAIAIATTTSLLRLVARRHHLSDVLVGVLIGVASGWLVPLLASYGGFGGTRAE